MCMAGGGVSWEQEKGEEDTAVGGWSPGNRTQLTPGFLTLHHEPSTAASQHGSRELCFTEILGPGATVRSSAPEVAGRCTGGGIRRGR